MTVRYVAVLATEAPSQPPPGIDPERWRLALAEDAYEVAAGLAHTRAAVVLPPGDPLADLTWPGTDLVPLRAEVTGTAARLAAALDGLARLGAGEAALVAADAPDLPPLLIGKVFRALGQGEVAVCPAEGGGLAVLATRLPAPDWLLAADVGLDTPDAPARLRAAAPARRELRFGPGWHRVRHPGELSLLDPGLEGWENTRALLTGQPL